MLSIVASSATSFLNLFLFLGGGYHGKSTILNALKVGIYNKVPGDGREFVVTDSSAISIRSEDGRYVAGMFDSSRSTKF